MSFLWNIPIFIFAAIWFVRLYVQMGGSLPSFATDTKNTNRVRASVFQLFSGNVRYNGEKATYKDLLWVAVFALAFRIGIYLISIVFFMISSDAATYSLQEFLDSWQRWDAPNYISIARGGYTEYQEEGQHLFLVFFPLYPWLLKFVHIFIPNWQIDCLVLSTVTYAIGCCFFYATLCEEYTKEIAQKALVLISVFPFAFFFGAMMTESLFFCTMSMGFYFIHRHQWLAVGITGILCSLCRVQGVLLLGVAGVEFLLTYPPITLFSQKKGRQFFKYVFTKGIFLLLIPVGNLIYFYINYEVEGDPFQFSVYQREHWYHSTIWFTKSVSEVLNNAISPTTTNTMKLCIWVPEITLFILTIVLLFVGLKRHHLKYTALLFVYTLINYSVTFLISGGRYMSCAFPLFIILAELLDKHPKVYLLLVSLSSMLMMIYLTGYFNWKQIM